MNVTEKNAVSKMGQPNQVTPTGYVLEIVQEQLSKCEHKISVASKLICTPDA
jgi:hypothetical protein